jgi:hypothetical protein
MFNLKFIDIGGGYLSLRNKKWDEFKSKMCAPSCTHFISRSNSNRRKIRFISRILSLEVSTIKRIRVSDLPESPEIGGLCMPAQPASDQVKRGQDKEELGQKNA